LAASCPNEPSFGGLLESQRSSRERSTWRLAKLAVAIEPDVADRRAADTLRTPSAAAVPEVAASPA
jgi:hypothetical protein